MKKGRMLRPFYGVVRAGSEPVASLDGAADLGAQQRHYVVCQRLEAAQIRLAARVEVAFAAQGGIRVLNSFWSKNSGR